jgi:hypothetical protein
MPSVPGHPLLDLRLAVQLVKITAITAIRAKTKNFQFLKNYHCNK